MKLLENRTRDSRQEMAAIEALEDIKELNARHADIKIEQMLAQKREQDKQYELLRKQLDEEEDEAEVQKAFGKRIVKIDPDDNEAEEIIEQNEEILPLSINAEKRKTTISFTRPNNTKKELPKNSLAVVIKKKPTTNDAVSKPAGGLSSLVASYDDNDDDDSS